MKKEKVYMPFCEDDVNWEELAGIGILKDELEEAGELTTLLSGEKTGILTLDLILLGADVTLDATLQLIEKKNGPIIEVVGIQPSDMTS